MNRDIICRECSQCCSSIGVHAWWDIMHHDAAKQTMRSVFMHLPWDINVKHQALNCDVAMILSLFSHRYSLRSGPTYPRKFWEVLSVVTPLKRPKQIHTFPLQRNCPLAELATEPLLRQQRLGVPLMVKQNTHLRYRTRRSQLVAKAPLSSEFLMDCS